MAHVVLEITGLVGMIVEVPIMLSHTFLCEDDVYNYCVALGTETHHDSLRHP